MTGEPPRSGEPPLHVERFGAGDPLIVLHGFGASSFTFRRWPEALSSRHEVFLVDLKGFGAAPKPPGDDYSPAALAADVHQLVLQHDLRRVTLVGHSLGGGVALLLSLRLLDDGEGRLERLVCIAGVAYRQAIPPYIDKARTHVFADLLLWLVPKRWLLSRVLASVVYDAGRVSDELIEGYARPLRSRDAQRALLAAARSLVPENLDELTARFGEIDVPALLLYGRQDPVVPLRSVERLAEALPRSRLVVLEECGHLPTEEKPEESMRVVREFLAGGSKPGAAAAG